MTKSLSDGWSREQDHPPVELLFLAMEGEADARTTERVRQHVDACWKCRSQWEKWQEAATAFVDYWPRCQQAGHASPPANWGGFRARLHRTVRDLVPAHPAFHRGFRVMARPLVSHWPISLAGVFASLVVAAAIHFTPLRTPDPGLEPAPRAAIAARPVRSVEPMLAPAAPESPTKAAVAPAPAAPSDSELEAAELQARVAVAESAADLNGQITLRRTRAVVVVGGVLDSPETHRALAVRLSAIGHVVSRVHSADEVRRTIPDSVTVPEPRTDAGANTSPPHPPLLDSRLMELFPDRVDRSAFVGGALDSSRTALLRAWALRRLANRYSAEREASLEPAQRRILRHLLAMYAAALQDDTERVRSGLATALEATATHPVVASSEGWQATVFQLAESIQQMDRALIELLSETDGPVSSTTVATENYQTALAATTQLVSMLADQLEQP